MAAFLWLNDLVYGGEPLELAKQIERVAERVGDLQAATDDFETWLRRSIEPRSDFQPS
jgi:hypothetical protein